MRILSLTLWVPLVGAVLVALLPASAVRLIRGVALGHAGLAFGLATSLLFRFDGRSSAIQLGEGGSWSPQAGVSYALGVDGLSLPLVLLTTGISVVALLASQGVTERVKGYFAWMLILETAILGVFMVQDWTLFLMFFEATLVPVFFLIGQWGGPRRDTASLNFVLYTMGGSIFLLLGLLAVYLATPTHSFAMADMAAAAAGMPHSLQVAVLLAFLLGFGVKFPIVPLHGWLPLAQVEAPTPVTVMLSAVMEKMGAYGLIRATVMLPLGARALQPEMLGLALTSILYGGLLAFRQRDLKSMIAYSSISHMGVVLLGISALNQAGLLGATLQMVAHSVLSASLFLMVGLISERTGTRDVADYGGLARGMPWFTGLCSLAFLGSMGLPGLVGFVAELHAMLGTLERFGAWTALACLGVLVTAAYAMRTLGRLFFGPLAPRMAGVADLAGVELVAAVPLAVATVAFGLQPDLLLNLVSATVASLSAAVAAPPG